MEIDDLSDLLLLLLYVPGASGEVGEPIIGITRLQKTLFLLVKETEIGKKFADELSFQAYKYGPFSSKLYDSINFLREMELIDTKHQKYDALTQKIEEMEYEEDYESVKEESEPETIEVFELKNVGKAMAEDIFENLDENQKNELEDIKKVVNSLPYLELIRFVYKKHPEYAKVSEIKEKVGMK
ncbi:MAG: DUF4065 domain-containing protein [Candidatus Methanofastidiosia archaeon]|jgi:hypothetical protein